MKDSFLFPKDEKPLTVVDQLAQETNMKLYGPKYCAHCESVQPIRVFKLAGSDFVKSEGSIVTVGYMGNQVCTKCNHVIEEVKNEN